MHADTAERLGDRLGLDVSLRPMGAPIPIALSSSAGASLALGELRLLWVAQTGGNKVARLVVGFGLLAELVGSTFSFLARVRLIR